MFFWHISFSHTHRKKNSATRAISLLVRMKGVPSHLNSITQVDMTFLS